MPEVTQRGREGHHLKPEPALVHPMLAPCQSPARARVVHCKRATGRKKQWKPAFFQTHTQRLFRNAAPSPGHLPGARRETLGCLGRRPLGRGGPGKGRRSRRASHRSQLFVGRVKAKPQPTGTERLSPEVPHLQRRACGWAAWPCRERPKTLAPSEAPATALWPPQTSRPSSGSPSFRSSHTVCRDGAAVSVSPALTATRGLSLASHRRHRREPPCSSLAGKLPRASSACCSRRPDPTSLPLRSLAPMHHPPAQVGAPAGRDTDGPSLRSRSKCPFTKSHLSAPTSGWLMASNHTRPMTGARKGNAELN